MGVGLTKLDINNLITNPNAQVIVAIPGVGSVVGYVQDGISLGGGNEFNKPLDSGALDSANSLINKGIAIGGVARKKKMSFVILKSPAQTLLAWTGSQKPQFNIPLTFVALDSADDPRDKVKMLYQTVYPTFGGKIGKLNVKSIMQAPLGYTGQPGKGTITVQIGKWFRAPNQLMVSVDFKFSKEVTRNGFPLYAEGSISFQPYRDIEYSEVEQYFITVPTGDAFALKYGR